MKNKIFKTSIVLSLLLTMTMANFIFVGKGLISYAADNVATNHKNVEFEAYFKNQEGKQTETLEKQLNEEETFLYLRVGVKKEGYFNGEIAIENSNFTLKEAESSYVNKIENNVITLNQINVGTTEEIKVKIEPIKEDNFEIGLLDMISKINLKGSYKDSTEKDINIKATRNVTLKLVENNQKENILNDMKVITNKIAKINGEEKRVIQISYHMGLKQNNYPMQEINAKIAIPEIDGKKAEIKKVEYLNNMTKIEEKNDSNNVELTLKNEPSKDQKVAWKKQGNENVILTCIYDKEAKTENLKINAYQKIKLYGNKEIETENQITVGNEELDAMLEVSTSNVENTIYKGKLNAGIDRQYQAKTEVKVNLASAMQELTIVENNSQYVMANKEEPANVTYNETMLNKQQFNKILGENGKITIYNQAQEEIGVITSQTQEDEQGNIRINYEGKEVRALKIVTTAPTAEGKLEFNHIKTINTNGENQKMPNVVALKTTVSANEKVAENSIKLEETKTEAGLEVDKETLSTVIGNNVEIKTILTSNNEKYDLYKNPKIAIQLPEQVQDIQVNSIDLLYENELKVGSYQVNGKTVEINLEGEQTNYKEGAVEGATVVMNANLNVDKKAATKDETIKMTYQNQAKQDTIEKGIKVVAPTDLTTIYSVPGLGIETLAQEQTKEILMARAAEEKQLEAQIEIINNNENAVQNVRILGQFPTNNKENNMGIEILNGINMQNAKIYYTENAEANNEIENKENGWENTISNPAKVSKYLIVIDQMESKASIQGSFTYKVPANLEYNQTAKTGYQVKYVNLATGMENELASTLLEMKTGVGPKLEAKLEAKANKNVKNGEVIAYKIQVSNVGTEDAKDVKVTGNVPEGTTLVVPEKNYEYTGASYYQELEDKTYETTIPEIKAGQAKEVTYEVRVNSNTEEGTTLSNQAQVQYGDITKQTEKVENVTEKGNLRVSVKRVTDRKVELYEGDTVKYYAIVENISNQTQNDVKVVTDLPQNLTVRGLELVTGMGHEEVEDVSQEPPENIEDLDEDEGEPEVDEIPDDNTKTEELEYKKELSIGALQPGEAKVLIYIMTIGDMKTNEINFGVTAKAGNEEYQSNRYEDEVIPVELGISMTSSTASQYVEAGDSIEYKIEVENKTNARISGLNVLDAIPNQLTITQVEKNGEIIEKEFNANNISLYIDMPAKSTANLVVKTIVDDDELRNNAEAITNTAQVEYNEVTATTQGINHIIKATSSNEQGTDGENNVDDSDIAKGNRTITGIAWFDENANGQKDQNEKTLSNIKVRLLNTKTNNFVKFETGETLEATTNENGIYVLDKIGNGSYIAVFDYDKSQYALTKYKVDGVAEEESSKAILNELTIGNEKQEVASTDIIEIQNNNIANINIGFIKLQNFDLALNKTVSKILIQNAKGTTVRQYDNETMAKVELDAKTINGSTVIIEYKIDVTNNGEIDGYAKKIVDYYAGTELKFSSELNKDWYQVGDALYTASLANEKIKPGETKTVTLTLSKAMTEDSTGLIPNTAEIAEDYNELGLPDSNSVPGNRAKDENDYGTAEVLLSIRTGGIVYITIAIITVAILGTTAVVVVKRKNKEDEE